MNHAATLCLLSVRQKVKAKFDNSSYRHSTLWRVISQYLVENGHNLSASQCQGKFERLAKEYKDEKKGKTGQGKLNFEYEEEMYKIFGDSVTIEPLLTYSAGSSVLSTKNANAMTENVGSTKRKGRSRPAARNKENKRLKEEL